MAPAKRDDTLFQRFDEICQRRTDFGPGAEGGEDQSGNLLPYALLDDGGQCLDDEAGVMWSELRDWEADWRAITKEAAALEAECKQEVLCSRSMNSAQLASLTASLADAEGDGQQWREAMWHGLGHLRKRVAALGRHVGPSGVPSGHVHAVSRAVEREIEVFKARQRQEFQALAAAESGVEEALVALARRHDAWLTDVPALTKISASSQPGGGARSRGVSPAVLSSNPSLDVLAVAGAGTGASGSAAGRIEDPEIVEIREVLKELEAKMQQVGGESGGWSICHHNIFLRIYRMHKMQASEAFYARVLERLPDVCEAGVVDHVRWFAENESKQAQKRSLLTRWRDRRRELVSQAEDTKQEQQSEEAALRRQAEKRERGQREVQQRRIADWRRARSEDQEDRIFAMQRAEQEQARLERERIQNAQLLQRDAIVSYRSHRQAERNHASEKERDVERASMARRALSQDDRQRIAQRNLENLKKRWQGGPARPAASPPDQNSCGSKAYEHVESRLYNTTQSFVHKTTVARTAAVGEPDSFDEVPSSRRRRPMSVGPTTGHCR